MKTIAGAGAIVVNENEDVLLVKVTRRGMVRWELPTAIQKGEESVLRTVFRCVEEESKFQFKVKIVRPVCFCLHISQDIKRSFYGMFFECAMEKFNGVAKEIINIPNYILPSEAKQAILTVEFHNWKEINAQEIHPLHRLILDKWETEKDDRLYAVRGDADKEVAFYRGSGPLDHDFLTMLSVSIDPASGSSSSR